MKSILFASLTLAVVIASSCGPTSTCEQVCLKANTCGVKDRAVDYDCPEYCADITNQQKKADAKGVSNCATEFNAVLTCWKSNLSNVCNADFDGCATAQNDWQACTQAYCDIVKDDDRNCTCAETDDDDNCIAYTSTLSPF